jgi:hypothetical protein
MPETPTRFYSRGELAALKAERFQRKANAESFREASDALEALCDWLQEVWDHFPDECDDYQAEECDRINRLIQEALSGHKGEIIAFVRKQREAMAAKGLGPRRDLVLFGVRLPAKEAAQ